MRVSRYARLARFARLHPCETMRPPHDSRLSWGIRIMGVIRRGDGPVWFSLFLRLVHFLGFRSVIPNTNTPFQKQRSLDGPVLTMIGLDVHVHMHA